jgi:hypothetical protein
MVLDADGLADGGAGRKWPFALVARPGVGED